MAMANELMIADEARAVTRLKADICIKNHVIVAMGVALVPSFFVELSGVTGIEVSMIMDLANLYAFPIPNRLIAYKVLLSLVVSLGPIYLAVKLSAGVKMVPVAGHAAYFGLMSLNNAAAVYAVGKIFQAHFESGGALLSKDTALLRSLFRQHYEEGRRQVPAFMAERTAPSSTQA